MRRRQRHRGTARSHRAGTAAIPALAILAAATLLASACSPGGRQTSSTSPSGSALSSPPSSGPGGGDPSRSTTAPTTGAASSGTGASTASYATAPCPNPIFADAPQLDLGPDFECGYLTVPQNRAEPDGATIRLAVARIGATAPNPAPDPIVYLTGGPGGSGLLSAVARVEKGWNSDRDVIFFDQRGTWKSEPLLACPEIDAFMAEWVTLDTLDPATAEKSGAAAKACRDRIAAEGFDPSDFNTTENAADVADPRVALAVDEWNLYGVSYGTDLALQTLRDHPDGIRSVVLDSVVPPQDNIFVHFWPSAAEGFRRLFDDCAADEACTGAFPNVRADFLAMVNELATQPRTVTVTDPATGGGVDVVVDGYKLANLVLTSSLAPGLIAPLPQIIDNLANGDGTLAATRLLAGVPPAGVTGYGLALGVFCSEHAPFTSAAEMARVGREVLPEFPDSVLALSPQAPFIFTDCAQWDVAPAPSSAATPVTSDVPALIVSGALDAVTAPPNAETVAAGFATNTELVFPDSAHDVMIWSPECGVAVLHGFLDDPAAVDDACVGGLAAPSFTTP